jgi:hypothetical protein
MRDLSHAIENTNYRKVNVSFSVIHLNYILGVLVVLISLTYLFTINTMATEGFRIKQLSKQITILEEEHKRLELENSKLQSVTTIQEQSMNWNFVPSTNITYIKDDSYALK